MKNFFLFAAVALMAASCTSDNDMLHESAVTNPEPTQVVLTFSPYQMEPMTRAGSVPGDSAAGSRRAPTTRAAVSISGIVDHLDVWIYESGNEVVAIHRNNAEHGQDFTTVSATLDKTKTYTLYAVAHKSAPATLADGIISWPDDHVTHSMYYSQTFTPAETTSLTCEMQRIVAQFHFETTDAVPDDVTQLRFTLAAVHDRWSITSGAAHEVNMTVTPATIANKADGTANVYLYAIATDAQTLHNVTVEALTATGDVTQQRTFQDVPLRNGYKTTYQGTYFTNAPSQATFTVESTWNTYDPVEF